MDYTLYSPMDDLDRLHEALNMPCICAAYDEVCREYVQNSVDIEPKRAAWAENLLSLDRQLLQRM